MFRAEGLYAELSSMPFIMDNSNFLQNFTLSPHNYYDLGNKHVVLTSVLPHASVMHLAFNMVGLWSFARGLVLFLNPTALFGTFTAAAVAGSYCMLAQTRKNKPSPWPGSDMTIGASGGVLGLAAANAVFNPKVQWALFGVVPVRAWKLFAGTLLFDIIGTYNRWHENKTYLAHPAHLGGEIIGLIVAVVVRRRMQLRGYIMAP